jgi:hypothetical protein
VGWQHPLQGHEAARLTSGRDAEPDGCPVARQNPAGPGAAYPVPSLQRHRPTIYDVLGITPPRVVNGIPQDPIDGVSFAYTFDQPEAPGRLHTQYFEIMGSRAIYHDGWMASAFGPRTPWVPGLPPGIADWTPDRDQWELYNLDEDWAQARDLAAAMPDKLAQMKETFAIEAARNSVYPVGGWPLDSGVSPRAADLHPVP